MRDKESANGSVQNSTGSCSGIENFVDSSREYVDSFSRYQQASVVAEVWEVKECDGQKQEDAKWRSAGCVAVAVMDALQ